MRQFASAALIAALSFALTACDSEPTDGPHEDRPYAGEFTAGNVGVFPNDRYAVPDDQTFTGMRVTFSSADFSGEPAWISIKRNIADQITGLDGFGTSAGGWVSFSERLDISDQAHILEQTQLGYMQGETPVIIPIEVTPSVTQIGVRPLIPLPPNVEAFLYTTTELNTAEGEAFHPAPPLQSILNGGTPEGYSDEVAQRTRDTADALIAAGHIGSRDDFSALSVFTTQSIHEVDLEFAAYIRDADADVQTDGPCTDELLYRACSFTFQVPNFIQEDGTVNESALDGGDVSTYRIRGWAFLPHDRSEPYRIPKDEERGYAPSIFGHGLTGGSRDGRQIARFMAEYGVASLSIAAPQHDDHPLRSAGDGEFDIIFDLFGISVQGSSAHLSTRHLRDGWRHSNYDKLALLEAMRDGLDFDNDGDPDIDISRLSYLGGSLGGIQGSQFLALSDDFVAGMYAVAGARISDIIRYGALFKLVSVLLFPQQNDASLLQINVLIQTAIERGDGVNWAPHVLENRLVGERIPHIAMQVSVPDEIVPPEAGMVIARAMGVDAIGEMPLPDPLVQSIGTEARLNHPSGVTAAVVQLDWIRRNPGDGYRVSEHARSADSQEGIAYWSHAFLTLFASDHDGVMELIDPYSLDDAPPRPTE